MASKSLTSAFAAIIVGILAIVVSLAHPAPRVIPAADTEMTPSHTEPSPEPASTAKYDWHTVVRAVDGDTLVVDINGTSTKVRLIGLDTPETVDPRKKVQCFGKEASDKMKQLVSVGYVRLEEDASQGTYDKYGRRLAYAYVPADSRPEGIMLNLYMIAEGYGHEYTYNLPYKYQAEFKAAETQAREGKRGLWADAACAQESTR